VRPPVHRYNVPSSRQPETSHVNSSKAPLILHLPMAWVAMLPSINKDTVMEKERQGSWLGSDVLSNHWLRRREGKTQV
jgi:hypothetical protein